ncbi:Glycylpeptide N-tetradecanoyltransferase 2 [Nosema granulosis]|uniref:Glycylpeptide N-tetradecanoyltransferase n=1 Tax=Nosema granulosis TaxID=83296 RepID=A0A9P6H028_9MICR|nr:Glycylpeptide N-tetradecanoyltransferase 2 [Nosema granulosis]
MEGNHRFWNTQPVEVGEGNSIIKHPSKILTEPLVLPEGFAFENVTDVKEISKFLSENYVEDVSEQFRLQYSDKFMNYIINNPKHKEEYSLGLRFNNKLVGYVFAREHVLVVEEKESKVASVNFLCVSKDLRGKRISPVLIKEITRRCNCNGIYQAIFTSGTQFSFKVSESNYYHRPLNVKKLVSTGFTTDTKPVKVPTARKNTRKATEDDIEKMFELYQMTSATFKLYEKMDFDDFKYNFLNDSEVISTYVNYNEDKLVSFGSYYILETFCIQKKMKIKGAYLYYCCGGEIKDVVSDLLNFASEEKCDVLNAIDIAESSKFIDSLDFCYGTGVLNYYLFNWKTKAVNRKDVFFYLQ